MKHIHVLLLIGGLRTSSPPLPPVSPSLFLSLINNNVLIYFLEKKTWPIVSKWLKTGNVGQLGSKQHMAVWNLRYFSHQHNFFSCWLSYLKDAGSDP